MDELNKYLSQTEFIPDLKVDVGFIISNDFYYGDENEWTAEEWKTQRQLLEKPSQELYGYHALSEAFEGNEVQLIRYYASVVQVIKDHNKIRKAGDSCFWLRPVVFHKEVNNISFPWYDTFVEALSFLDVLAKNEDGWIFDDMEQGWQVAVYAEGDKFHFIQRVWESDEPVWLASGDRAALSAMAKQCIQRVKKQIDLLTAEVGTDFWTKREKINYE